MVAVAVCEDLGFPVAPIIFGQSITSWAAVPKTTINKYCHSLHAENEVRLAGKINMSAPAGDSSLAQ